MLLKKYFWLIYLVLTTLLVWAGVNLALTVVSGKLQAPSITGKLSSEPGSTRNSGPPPLDAYNTIVRNNIFNPGAPPPRPSSPSKKSSKPASGGAEPPLTALKVVLKGTAVREPQSASFAVIYNPKTRKQKLYRVGDSIEDATIQLIMSDRVILKRGEHQETLFISRGKSGNGEGTPPSRPVGGVRSLVRQTDAHTYVLDRDQVKDIVTNINQFMTQLRVRPYFLRGKPVGYLITDIKKGSLIEQIGLRNGDILKSVNGMPITRPEQAFAAYQQLMDESQITLELQRGRTSQVITYELK